MRTRWHEQTMRHGGADNSISALKSVPLRIEVYSPFFVLCFLVAESFSALYLSGLRFHFRMQCRGLIEVTYDCEWVAVRPVETIYINTWTDSGRR